MANFVTLDHVTAVAKTLVKTADNMDRNIWKEWICTLAIPELGLGDAEIDTAELIPKALLAPLPVNMKSLLELSLFDSAGNQLSHKFRTGRNRIFTDRRLSDSAVVSSNNSPDALVPVDVSNDAYNFILGTNGTNVAKIYVRFFKRPFDETGMPLIHEDDMTACIACIKYYQALRDDDNQAKIAAYQQTWYIQSDRSRAAKKMSMMNPEHAKTVLKEMMRLIPSFDHSQF